MSDMTTDREARAAIGAAGRAGVHASRAAERASERTIGTAFDTAMATGMAWLDLVARMQRASLASLSVYSPGMETRISAARPEAEREAVVALGEERLNVGTRTELGETTRIRRRVVAAPVEQEVTLRDERVVLERRPGRTDAAVSASKSQSGDVLSETVVEMSDSRQLPQVWKSVHVTEEVVLRREVTERKERVRETLRRDVLEVEHDGRARPLHLVGEHERADVPSTGRRIIGEGSTEAARLAADVEAKAAENAEALAHAAAEATRPRAETEVAPDDRRRRDGMNKDQAAQPNRKN